MAGRTLVYHIYLIFGMALDITCGQEFDVTSISTKAFIKITKTTLAGQSYNIKDTSVETTEEYTSIQDERNFVTIQDKIVHMKYLQQTTIAIPSIDDDVCYAFKSCEKPEEYPNHWHCYCDDRCEEFNDCCLEYNTTGSIKPLRNVECIRLSNDLNSIYGIIGISDCPEGYTNNSVITKCKQNNMAESGPPVTNGNVIIYKNKFCALCHNVTDMVPFDVKFNGFFYMTDDELFAFDNLTRDEKLQLSLDRAFYTLLPPANIEMRPCIGNLIENDTPLCKQYVNPVLIGFGVYEFYRNYHCIPSERKMFPKVCLVKYMASGYNSNPSIKLSVMFSFKDTDEDEVEGKPCEQWTKEIAASPACSQLVTYSNVKVDIEYYLVSDVNITFEDMIRIGIVSAWSFNIANFSTLTFEFQLVTNEVNSVAKIQVAVKILKRSFMHEIESIKEKFSKRNITLIFRDNTTEESFFIKSRSQLPNEVENTNTFPNSYLLRIFRDVFHVIPSDGVYLPDFVVDKLSRELTIEILKDSDDMVHIESFHYEKVSIKKTSQNNYLSILTYSCFSVSIVSLFCLIVYNRKQNLVSSIPSSNLENLCVSLLISNLLFMVGIGAYKVSRLCYIIGITLHYLWLSVFSYMTISVIYIVTNIVKIKSRNTQSIEKTRFRRRLISVVGFLIPMVFVVPTVAVDIFGPNYLLAGYGGNVCFPNRYPANLIFFSGPVIISLAVNFVCLFSIIIQICRVRLSMRHIRKSEPYRDAKIYLRIVILSGIFWVTGIIAMIFENEELEYIFTILCGLQGCWIAVANLTTAKVQCLKLRDRSS